MEEVLSVRARLLAPSHSTTNCFSGYLSARYNIPLGFEVQGRILKRHVDVGSKVKQGDLIAELDPRYYAYNLSDLNSRLKGAQSTFARATLDLRRAKQTDPKRLYLPNRIGSLHRYPSSRQK